MERVCNNVKLVGSTVAKGLTLTCREGRFSWTSRLWTPHGTPIEDFIAPPASPTRRVPHLQVGDAVYADGEACRVLHIDRSSRLCTVRSQVDGRALDTRMDHLTRADAYPERVYDGDICPICCQQVAGESSVPCCTRCEASAWLHRRCLLLHLCGVDSLGASCPMGHTLTERDNEASGIHCGRCHGLCESYSVQWHCAQCDWALCRSCIMASCRPEASCPTCKGPLPFNEGMGNPFRERKPVLVLDSGGVHHPEVQARRPAEASWDRLFTHSLPSKALARTRSAGALGGKHAPRYLPGAVDAESIQVRGPSTHRTWRRSLSRTTGT